MRHHSLWQRSWHSGGRQGIRRATHSRRYLQRIRTPRVDFVYYQAMEAAHHDLLCHANDDIILMYDFGSAVECVFSERKWFQLARQRWNVNIETPLDFSASWKSKLKNNIAQHGELGARTGLGHPVLPRGLRVDLPPYAIGRRLRSAVPIPSQEEKCSGDRRNSGRHGRTPEPQLSPSTIFQVRNLGQPERQGNLDFGGVR